MSEEKEYIFKKLTPKKDIDNLRYYEEALDFALNDPEIKDVAITGVYGAGKSSILESYKKVSKFLSENDYLHISLADYKDTLNDSKQETINNEMNYNIDNKTLEGKILNQLLHQIDPKDIPQSIFQLKRNVALLDILIPTLFIILFIINIYYLWYFSDEVSNLGWNIFFLIIQLSIIIYYLIKLQLNKKVFKKLSIRSANVQSDIEVFEDSEESYFDKYLDDVIYLFYNSGAKVIVFEDIDRFENNLIFAKLKEINTLVNHHKKKDDKITFVYMLKDDMFLSKDRTKFFDFIIPIIPFVNSSNSYDLLKEQLELQPNLGESDGENLFDLFDNYFLLKLSIYIDDMRLLLNTVNEFIIYYGRLNLLPLDVNKLFAIIVYKNILPNDFAELQLNTGFVYQIFENKDEYTISKRGTLQEKINNLKIEIEKRESENLHSKFEIYSLYFKGKNDYINLRVNGKQQSEYSNMGSFMKDIIEAEYELEGQKRNYTNWYRIDLVEEFKEIESNPKFIQRLKNIENRNRTAELQNEIKKLKNQSRKLKESRLYKVITRKDIENLENKHFTGKLTEFENIKNDFYFDLLVFLITNGHLDEDYPFYITYFHENSLTIEDQKFLKGVYDNRYLGANFKISNIPEVYNRLENQDFLKKETLNIQLFRYILATRVLENRTDRLSNNYKMIDESNQLDFFMQMYFTKGAGSDEETSIRNEALIHLSKHTPSLLKKVIKNDVTDIKNRIILIFDALNFYDRSYLNLFDEDKEFIIDFINKSSEMLYDKLKNSKQFTDNITYWDIKFENIEFDKVFDSKVRDYIFSESLYKITFNNLTNALYYYYGEKNFEEIKHQNYTLLSKRKESALTEYIENNINDYLDAYLQFSEGDIKDDVKIIYSIINNDSIREAKRERYIQALEDQILLISEVENENFYNQLLMENKLMPNAENILLNFKYFEDGWSEELIEFVNSSKENIEFNWPKNNTEFDDDYQLIFFQLTVKENRLDNSVYRKIIRNINKNSEEDLPLEAISSDKVKVLIELDILIFSTANLREIRVYHSELLMEFISKNLMKYLKSVHDSSTYDHEELIDTLDYHKDALVQKQKAIVDEIKKPITIIDKNYHTYVLNHILKTKLSIEDLDYLIQSYDDFGVSTQRLVLKIVYEQIDYIIEYKINLTKYMLNILIYNHDINLEARRLLFSRNIQHIEKDNFKEIFKLLDYNQFIEVINGVRRNYKINKNESTKNILENLDRRGLISTFEIIEDNYRVNSNQKKDLI